MNLSEDGLVEVGGEGTWKWKQGDSYGDVLGCELVVSSQAFTFFYTL